MIGGIGAKAFLPIYFMKEVVLTFMFLINCLITFAKL
jgi:hypothetical protein